MLRKHFQKGYKKPCSWMLRKGRRCGGRPARKFMHDGIRDRWLCEVHERIWKLSWSVPDPFEKMTAEQQTTERSRTSIFR